MPLSLEHRKKLSLAHTGKKCSEETKKRMSESHMGLNTWSKGKALSQSVKNTISARMKGCIPWNKGTTKAEFPQMSNSGAKGKEHWNKGKRMPQLAGENNAQWLGDKVNYRGLHEWVERLLGKPHNCEECGRTNLRHRQYHWANKSRTYQRVITDWVRLCAKCHKTYDRNQFALSFQV